MIYVLSGGGNAEVVAFINATYPAGSTCICTDGAKTLKLKDTSGQGIFYVPYLGQWKVKCYDGADYDSSDNKKSADVEIAAEGQSKSVVLSYVVILYQTGTNYQADSGGWSTVDYATVTADSSKLYVASDVNTGSNVNRYGYVHANNLVDLTNINTITAICTAGNFSFGSHELVILDSSKKEVSSAKISQAGTVTLPASAFTGNYYVGFKTVGFASYDGAGNTNSSYSKVICE